MARTKQHSRATFQNYLLKESKYKEPGSADLAYKTEFHGRTIRNCKKTLITLMEKPHTIDEIKALVKFKKTNEVIPEISQMNQDYTLWDLFNTSLEKHAPLLRINSLLYEARVEEDYGLLSYHLKEFMEFDWATCAYLCKHHFLTTWVDTKTLKRYYEGIEPSGMPKGIDQVMFDLWLDYKYENYGLPKKDRQGRYFGVEKYEEQWKNNNAREKILTLVEAKAVREIWHEYIRGASNEYKELTTKQPAKRHISKDLPHLIQDIAQDLKKRARQANLKDWQLKIFQVLLMTTNHLMRADKNNLYYLEGGVSARTNHNIELGTRRAMFDINRHARWLYGRQTTGLHNRTSETNAHSKYVEFYRISQQLGYTWSFNEYVYLNMFHKLTYDEKKNTFFEAK